MKIIRTIGGFGLVVVVFVLHVFARAQGLEEHGYSPVTVTETWQAVLSELRVRGFGPEKLPLPEALELPVAVPARIGRKLEVSSVCWDADSARVRYLLECRPAGACLRFLAYLRGSFGPDEHGQAPSCRTEGADHLRTPSPRAAPSVRAGQRATVVLAASGLRMTAIVTCLDHGAQGEVVRVRGQEGRVFRARVTGKALVEKLPE